MQLNFDILNKMGWFNYSMTRGIVGLPPNSFNLFSDDGKVRMFFISDEYIYVIKEVTYPDHLFIRVDKSNFLKMDVSNFSDNLGLLSIVKENLACNKKYKRLLKINSIHNEKRS